MPGTTRESVCVGCGQPYSYTPLVLLGEELPDNQLCIPCDEKRLAEARAEHARTERTKRLIAWDYLDLPLKDTAIEKLPHPRGAIVARWKYGAKAPFCHGPSGQGKSRALIALCRRLWVDDAKEFRFVPWTQWQGELDKAHRYGGYGMKKEIELLYRWPLVIFDDVGKGKPTEHVVSAFFSVIDYRASRGLPTAISTKYSLSREPGSAFEQRLALGAADAARDTCRRICESSLNSPFIPAQT